MKGPEPSLDDLIRAHREGAGMTPAQRARNRSRLLSRAAAGAAVSSAALGKAWPLASTLPAQFSKGWGLKLVLGLALGGAAGTLYVALRPGVAPTTKSTAFASAPAATLAQPAAPSEVASPKSTAADPSASELEAFEPATPKLATPETTSTEPAVSATAPARGRERVSASLAAEVQLMHDVDSALRSGQPELALRLLDQRRKADGGFMKEERTVARIVTLCQLRRVDAARAEATRFLRERPRSPLAARVRATCAKPFESSAPGKTP